MATSVGSTVPEVYESYPDIAPEKYAGKLNGKVALVTGVSSGIGRSIAKAMANAGASVACVARRENEVNALVDEIKKSNGVAVPIIGDVAAKGAAKQIVSQVEQALGPVDVLVSNAGISRISPLSSEEDLDIWWRVYEVNVRAPVALVHACLPSMLKRNTGCLITTGSSVATMPLPVMTAYSSSKAAISKFHETLSKELEDTNIITFSVHPGQVKTELGAASNAVNKDAMGHPAMQKFIASVTGSDHKGQSPEICADTMVALAADPSYKILTGHHINATQPLTPVLKEAQKEGKGRLGAERLYLVNIATL